MRIARFYKLPLLLVVACGDVVTFERDLLADGGTDAAEDSAGLGLDAETPMSSRCTNFDQPVIGARVDEHFQCIGESAQVGCRPATNGCATALSYGRDAAGVLWQFSDLCQPRETTPEQGDFGSYPPCSDVLDGASRELSAVVEGEAVRLSSSSTGGAQPLYGKLCGGLIVLNRGRAGKFTVVPREAQSETGPYLLDGLPATNDGCQNNPCVPLDGQRVSREEVVPELNWYGFPDQHDLESRFSTRLASSPLRLQLGAYTDANCSPETLRYVNVDVSPTDLPLPPPLSSIIRVSNASSHVQSRFGSCGTPGTPAVTVRRAAGESTYQPICAPVSCDIVPADTVLATDTPCASLPCFGSRVDLAPGSAEPDFTYDGVFERFTDRTCVERIPLALGTAMEATVCYGKPVPGDMYGMTDSQCTSVPFSYGQQIVDIALQ